MYIGQIIAASGETGKIDVFFLLEIWLLENHQIYVADFCGGRYKHLQQYGEGFIIELYEKLKALDCSEIW